MSLHSSASSPKDNLAIFFSTILPGIVASAASVESIESSSSMGDALNTLNPKPIQSLDLKISIRKGDFDGDCEAAQRTIQMIARSTTASKNWPFTLRKLADFARFWHQSGHKNAHRWVPLPEDDEDVLSGRCYRMELQIEARLFLWEICSTPQRRICCEDTYLERMLVQKREPSSNPVVTAEPSAQSRKKTKPNEEPSVEDTASSAHP